MIVVIGLRALTAAAVAAVTGVATNSGSTQPLSDNFVIFGQHLNGLSTRQLVLHSIAVSVVGLLGWRVPLRAFARSPASRGTRRALMGSRRGTTALRVDVDRLTREPAGQCTERSRVDAVSIADSVSIVDSARTDWSGQVPPPVENNPRPKPVRSAGTRSRRALRHQAPHQATGCSRNPAPCGPAVRRCPISSVAADHHDAERYPGHHHPRQRQHHRRQRQRRCAGGVYLRVIDGVKPVVPIENVRASR